MTALESFGLGGVFVGGIRNGIARADDVLVLPQNVFPVVGLAFGYPAEKNELKPRLPLEVTVMENSYSEPDPAVMAALRRRFARLLQKPHGGQQGRELG